MKSFFLTFLILSSAWAQDSKVPEATLGRLSKLYPDQSLEFIKERLKNAPTEFNKWRSFVPYYYEMIKRSEVSDLFKKRMGLCAGDPHLENFGYISESKDKSLFTLNDLDDVTECSLDRDLMRLFIGQKMIRPDLKAEAFLTSYKNGLAGKTCPAPDFIKSLEADSLKKGRTLSKKNKALLDSMTCTGEYVPLTESERLMLNEFIQDENLTASCQKHGVLKADVQAMAKNFIGPESQEIAHACSRTKDSGGSAGGKRFVIFRKSTLGVVDAFELKPLVKAAPDFDLAVTDDKREAVFVQAVKTYLGPSMKDFYYPVRLQNKLYQRRPLWAGNTAVKAEDFDKSIESQKEDVMLFESCKLGGLHARSNPGAFEIALKDWERASSSLEAQFRSEFGQ